MLILLIFTIAFVTGEGVKLTNFTPRTIYSNGVMLFIWGSDFSKTTFSFDNPKLGNKVFLKDLVKSYSCEIHPDKCNTHQLTCYIPKMPTGKYRIHVIVDSIYEKSIGNLYYWDSQTPTLEAIENGVSIPGSLLTYTGSFKTVVVGSDAFEGDEIKLVRAFIGGAKCNMMNESSTFEGVGFPGENDQVFGISTSEIKCKNEGGYVGYQNGSILISGPYGRTKQTFSYITPDEQLYMHQTYAVIKKISQEHIVFQEGSQIQIEGEFFDATESPIEVTVGSRRCRLLENSDQFISCTLDADIGMEKKCLGSRGAYIYEWEKEIDIENEAISTATNKTWVDGFPVKGWEYNDSNQGFMRFVLTIPLTSTYGTGGVEVSLRKLQENTFKKWKDPIEMVENEEYEVRIPLALISSFQLRQYKTRFVTHSHSSIVNQLSVGFSLTLTEPGIKGEMVHTFKTEYLPDTYVLSLQSGNVNVYDVKSSIGQWVRWKFGNFMSASFQISLGLSFEKTSAQMLEVMPQIKAYIDLLLSLKNTEKLYEIKYEKGKLTLTLNPIMKSDEEIELVVADESMKVVDKETTVGEDSQVPIGWWQTGSYRSAPFIDLQVRKPTIIENLKVMFQNHCPEYMINSDVPLPDGTKQKVFAQFSGYGNMADEKLCGRTSYKINHYIEFNLKKNRIIDYPTICFGVKGTLSKIQYLGTVNIDIMSEEKEFSEWSYECVTIDKMDFISQKFLQVDKIRFFGQAFIDEITIRKNKISVDTNQIIATPSKRVKYNQNELDGNKLMLKFLIQSTQCQPFGDDDIQLVSSKNDMATANKLDNDVDQLKGNVLLKSDELSQTISVDVTEMSKEDLEKSIYMNLKEYTNVKVDEISNECDNKNFLIKFPRTTKNFDIEISKEQMVSSDKITLTTQVNEHYLGYVNLPGDFIRPLMEECENSDKVAVSVKINGINSKCCGNCLVSVITPAEMSIVDISNDGTNQLSIRLNDEISTDNLKSFKINLVNEKGETMCCQMKGIDGDILTCLLQEKYLEGPLIIKMVSDDFGKIVNNSKSAVQIIPQVDQIEYNDNMVKVTGRYLPSDNNILKIDNKQCSTLFPNHEFILFDCPINSQIPQSIDYNGEVIPINKLKKNLEISTTRPIGKIRDYEMKYGSKKRIVSRKFSEVMILKGEQLDNVTKVFFGTEKHLAKIVVADEDEIFLQTPETIEVDGIYSLGICEDVTCELQEVEVEFAFGIYDISPKCGSWYGGTNVTVHGFGLPFDCSNAFISMNDNRRCRLMECMNDKIICQTASGVNELVIDNSGYSETMGDKFNWHPRTTTAKIGQKITWIWKYSSGYSQTVAPRVIEVNSNGEQKSNGFSSGSLGRIDGTYSRIFSTAGTYYFSSGIMMKDSTHQMFGKIIVLDETEVTDTPQTNTLKVYIDNKLVPIYETPNTLTLNEKCQNEKFQFEFRKNLSPTIESIDANQIFFEDTVSVIRGTNIVKDAEKHQIFAVQFKKREDLLTDPSSVYPRRIKVIDKQKFAQCISINELNKENEIHCRWKLLSPINYGQSYWLDVNIGDGYGQSLIRSDANAEIIIRFKYVFRSISPTSGSTYGNNLMTLDIKGVPTYEVVQVKIGENECRMKPMVGLLKCVIPPNNVGSEEVTVSLNGAEYVSCASCDFVYDSSLVYRLTGFEGEKKILDEENLLKILGTNLIFEEDIESDENYIILLNKKKKRKYECNIMSMEGDYLTCKLPPSILPGEYQLVSIVTPQIGMIDNKISSNLFIDSEIQMNPSVVNMYPNGGNVIEFLTVEQFDDINNQIFFHSTTNDKNKIKCLFITDWKIQEETTINKKYCVVGFKPVVEVTEYIPYIYRYGQQYKELTDFKLVMNSDEDPVPSMEFDDLTINDENEYFATLKDVDSISINITTSQLLFWKLSEKRSVFTDIIDLTDNKLKFKLKGGKTGVDYRGSFRANNIRFLQTRTNTLRLEKTEAKTKFDLYYAGGGQRMEIDQLGFSSLSTNITVGDVPCGDVQINGPTLSCLLPPLPQYAEESVAVKLQLNDEELTISPNIKISADDMMTVSYIPKLYGGSGGGSVLEIQGKNFKSTCNLHEVRMGGRKLACEKSYTNTKIRCETLSKLEDNKNLVQVFFDCDGSIIPTIFKPNPLKQFKDEDHKRSVQSYNQEINEKSDGVCFTYIDRWSSIATWNNENVPEEGDFIIVNKKDTIVLDTTTPVLKFLLIKGGKLIFDPIKSAHLKTENILITEGGTLEIGTEEKPYMASGKITMFGHLRSTELPLFGSKTLALREGTIDIHGKEIGRPFTVLGETAKVGDTQIKLKDSVPWEVGSLIVIATTGDRVSMNESELATIKSIDGTGKIIGLEKALEHEHLGITTRLNGKSYEIRGEVALLSRNIKFSGFSHPSWHVKIPACTPGFDPGEFSVQTCFQGRFGEEIGSDQFGGAIMVSQEVQGSQSVQLRISNLEMEHVGQAFRLGRYPIHFHRNGHMAGSYVRATTIRNGFNRAINVHDTHNVMVEHNVAYNIMGGAFFFEDGSEQNNTMQYNLVMFVKASTSLLNDDITPAAYWITHPTNYIRHNHAVGGTHFGFWYRMHEHPDGPSATTDIFCQLAPLAEFHNNTVHSVGWFGLWIHKNYTPEVTAHFTDFYTWNNEKGIEVVVGGKLKFSNFVSINEDFSGFEGKYAEHFDQYSYTDGYLLENAFISAKLRSSDPCVTSKGVLPPWGSGFMLKNIEFYGFDTTECSAISGPVLKCHCKHDCGGYMLTTENLKFIDSPNRILLKWLSQLVLVDKDGSLTNKLPYSSINTNYGLAGVESMESNDLNKGAYIYPPKWRNWVHFGITAESFIGSICMEIEMPGLSDTINQVTYEKNLIIKRGYMGSLQANETGLLTFVSCGNNSLFSPAAQLQLNLVIEDLPEFSWIIIGVNLKMLPDKVTISNWDVPSKGKNSDKPLSYDNNVHGDWYYDANDEVLKFLLTNNGVYDIDAIKCDYPNCEEPSSDVDTSKFVSPISGNEFEEKLLNGEVDRWSDVATWNKLMGMSRLPQSGDNVTIGNGKWVLMDVEEVPRLNALNIYGNLVFDRSIKTCLFQTNYINVFGRLVIGWVDKPMLNKCTIRLYGKRSDPFFEPKGFTTDVGSKFIAVYGTMDIHGRKRFPSWTRSQTAIKGNTIRLVEPVEWEVNDEISVGAFSDVSNYKIISISDDRQEIKVNSTIFSAANTEYSYDRLTNGQTTHLTPVVALLTRYVTIEGDDNAPADYWGSRIIVTKLIDFDYNEKIGTARISHVAMRNFGHESLYDESSPHYGIAFFKTADSFGLSQSYVLDNSFVNGNAPAIGSFGETSNLIIKNNVIYRAVRFAIRTTGISPIIRSNVILDTIDGFQLSSDLSYTELEHTAVIYLIGANAVQLIDNVVIKSYCAAYNFLDYSCTVKGNLSEVPDYNSVGRKSGQIVEFDETKVSIGSLFVNNHAYGSLVGTLIIPSQGQLRGDCVLIADFVFVRQTKVAVYAQSRLPVHIQNVLTIENAIGIYVIPYRMYTGRHVRISDSVIVGRDKNLPKCTVLPTAVKLEGVIGVGISELPRRKNKEPTKDILTRESNPYFDDGYLQLDNVKFVGFGKDCLQSDAAISTLPHNDDSAIPVYLSNMHWESVTRKVFNARPRLGMINPTDCVDMECDGLKKVLIVDTDGTSFGSVGATAFSMAELAYNGDKRRGIGDYRIPASMTTDKNGASIKIDKLVKDHGIVRNDECKTLTDSQMHLCYSYTYAQLILTNNDFDKETRRLSPIAILSDDGFVDLLNGPQDEAWCFGYTCKLRLSHFMALVALEKSYKIYLGTTTFPENFEIKLKEEFGNIFPNRNYVLLKVFIRIPIHMTVYYENKLVESLSTPQNGTDAERLMWERKKSADNYYDEENQLLYISMKSNDVVQIVRRAEMILKFETEFFQPDKIIDNIARMFNIDKSRIKPVKIVKERNNLDLTRRRKRAVEKDTIQVIIDTPPEDDITQIDMTKDEDILRVQEGLLGAFYDGSLGDILGAETLDSVDIVETVPPVNSSSYGTFLETNPDETVNSGQKIMIPSKLTILTKVDGCVEQVSCRQQPAVQLLSSSDEAFFVFGSSAEPWKIFADLIDSDNNVVKTFEAMYKCGNATFTDIYSPNVGEYQLRFYLDDRSKSNKTINSELFTINKLEEISGQTKSFPRYGVVMNEKATISFELIDTVAKLPLSDISWKNHSWNIQLSVHNESLKMIEKEYEETLNRTLLVRLTESFKNNQPMTATTVSSNNEIIFNDISFSSPALYIFEICVKSEPEEYSFKFLSKPFLVNDTLFNEFGQTITESNETDIYQMVEQSVSYKYKLKNLQRSSADEFDADEYEASVHDLVTLNQLNVEAEKGVEIDEQSKKVVSRAKAYRYSNNFEGDSFELNYFVAGSRSAVAEDLEDTRRVMCEMNDDDDDRLALDRVTVDGEEFSCVIKKLLKENKKTNVLLGVLCGLGAILIIGAIVGFIIWYVKKSAKKPIEPTVDDEQSDSKPTVRQLSISDFENLPNYNSVKK
ncbi:hypothetical protein SNEBB_007570 [Seison nebaliae]|nr:hypothetical protein SNEBB_007570 [Seison nebaliae]